MSLPPAWPSPLLNASVTASSISDDYDFVHDYDRHASSQPFSSVRNSKVLKHSPERLFPKNGRTGHDEATGLERLSQTEIEPMGASICHCALGALFKAHEATILQFFQSAGQLSSLPAGSNELDSKLDLDFYLETADFRNKLNNVAKGLAYTRTQLLALEDDAYCSDYRSDGCLRCSQEPLCSPSSLADDISQLSDSSSNAPEQFSEYFRLKRQEFVLRERVNELRLDISEQQSLGGDASMCSAASIQLAALTEALELAQGQSELQREACIEQGHDPELYRHRRISSRSNSDQNIIRWLNQEGSVDPQAYDA